MLAKVNEYAVHKATLAELRAADLTPTVEIIEKVRGRDQIVGYFNVEIGDAGPRASVRFVAFRVSEGRFDILLRDKLSYNFYCEDRDEKILAAEFVNDLFEDERHIRDIISGAAQDYFVAFDKRNRRKKRDRLAG